MSANSGLVVQFRVLHALVLREIHTLYGNTTLGYLWAVFQCLTSVLIFWAIRYFAGFHAAHGMSVLAFLLSGFLPWYIFSDTLNKCMSAVSANTTLLTYAQVTSLDLMIARMIVVWATQIISSILLIVLAFFVNQDVVITNYGYLFLSLIISPLFGLSIGSLVFSLSYYWSPILRIIPIIMRILFFISGIFFSVKSIPHPYRDYLLFNPIMHLIELTRLAVSQPYITSYLDIEYLFWWFFISLSLSLLLERFLRGKNI